MEDVLMWSWTKSYGRLRTPPPVFVYGDCTQNITVKKYNSYGVNFSDYFMKILVFSQMYRSKPATPEIAYDTKIDLLLYNLYLPLKQQSAKKIRTYIQI